MRRADKIIVGQNTLATSHLFLMLAMLGLRYCILNDFKVL